jgi:hypothetical protein
MEVAKIYDVRCASDSEGWVIGQGARRTRAEAQALLNMYAQHFREVGRDYRLWIEEVDDTGLFEIPSRPTPRERYSAAVKSTTPPDAWPQVDVEIVEGDRVAASYHRNYGMLRTFEPFRQGQRDFALISPRYTATSVVDLASGGIIAGEEPAADGFCPAGFYVPDWWDVHSGIPDEYLPGSLTWSEDYEWPTGEFGFVWGCVWGDDNSWKVQYLDLSGIQDGVLRRDDRFGYLELAAHPDLEAHDFIVVESDEGDQRVEFAVPQQYDLNSGRHTD